MSTSDIDSVDRSHFLSKTTSSRRSFLKRAVAIGVAVPSLASLLAACDSDDETDDEALSDTESDDSGDESEEPEADDEGDETTDENESVDDAGEGRYGGTLNVALTGDPPGIDIQWILGGHSTLLGMHMWETILTWDEDYVPVPELAESINVSDDGLTIDIALREGVLFHNGEEMTSEDVIASLERWIELSPRSDSFAASYDELNAIDDYSVEIQLKETLGPLMTLLARYPASCGIYPASVIAASDGRDLAEIVGTGPYEFVEYLPDQHIHMRRFEDYVGREEATSGYAGRKEQYVDEIFFIPVPNEATRVAGLQSGDFDYLQEVSSDQYETIDEHPDTVAAIGPRTAPIAWVLNMAEGICSNQTLRQALLAAIDAEEVMSAGYAEGFYDLDPSMTFPATAWYSTRGEEFYNQANPERARELAEEAGYDGEPIRFMTSPERSQLHNMAMVTTQQLEDAGFTIDLQLMDVATMQERRDIPGDWDMFAVSFGFFPDPIMIPNVAGTSWTGWWDTEHKNELVRQFVAESDYDARYEIWEEIQGLYFEDVPMIVLGHASHLVAHSARLQNPPEYFHIGASFWNSWLDDEA